jgi:glycine cleavage system H protein
LKGEHVSQVPDDRRYTKEHEWVQARDGRVVVGITHFAQDQLGDVVFVELPAPGTEVEAGKPLGEVESTKSVSDVYSPVSGKVLEANAAAEAEPELINSDPYGAGWLVAIDTSDDIEALMSAADYQALVGEGA